MAAGGRPEGHADRRGHRHQLQEEVYFLVSDWRRRSSTTRSSTLEPWTCREGRPRDGGSFRAAGDEDAVFVSIAAPQAGFDDVEFLPGLLAGLGERARLRGVPGEPEGIEAVSSLPDEGPCLADEPSARSAKGSR